MSTCEIWALLPQPLYFFCSFPYRLYVIMQVTALWVTHRLEELEWADSVSYMDQGRIQFTGSPKEASEYLRRLGAHV